MVIEWDIKTGKPKCKYAAHGSIWDSKIVEKFIYLACEDGSLKIVKVRKNKIELVKMLMKSNAACLSLETICEKKQYQKKDDSEEEDEDLGPVSHLIAGYADGTIKKWEIKTGNCVLHIEKQTKKEQKKEGPCLIWKLKLFNNEAIVSGDSKGEVCIWDINFGTLTKCIKFLKADILALEVSNKLNSIYATGVDSRVINITLNQDPETGFSDWILSSIFRG